MDHFRQGVSRFFLLLQLYWSFFAIYNDEGVINHKKEKIEMTLFNVFALKNGCKYLSIENDDSVAIMLNMN